MNKSPSEFRRYPHPLVGLLCICLATTATASSESNGKLQFARQDLVLPGAEGLVSMDYFAFDPINGRLWVPASNTGTVAIIDSRTGQISSISGFRTAPVEFRGKRPVMGPTSVSLGDGVAYVGNRGDSTVCAISLKTQTLGMCESIGAASAGLAAAPDALTYVAASRELWVTRGVPPMNVPSFNRAITVLDAAKPTSLRKKDTIPLGASAEGFAVDSMRGRFYTSLEEPGETVAIDVHSHKIVARWHSGCDEPHGLALDAAQGVLFVACMARVVSMDIAHDGHVLGSIETGSGLDNIDYLPSKHLLYAAAADAAQLTLARVDDHGVPHRIAVWPTQKGARGVVVDSDGNAFVMDPYGGRILKFTPQSSLDAR